MTFTLNIQEDPFHLFLSHTLHYLLMALVLTSSGMTLMGFQISVRVNLIRSLTVSVNYLFILFIMPHISVPFASCDQSNLDPSADVPSSSLNMNYTGDFFI